MLCFSELVIIPNLNLIWSALELVQKKAMQASVTFLKMYYLWTTFFLYEMSRILIMKVEAQQHQYDKLSLINNILAEAGNVQMESNS